MGCGCNNGCGGFGGNSCWIIILLLLCCGGCGENGFGGGMDCCWMDGAAGSGVVDANRSLREKSMEDCCEEPILKPVAITVMRT